jgi:hypothetical protein
MSENEKKHESQNCYYQSWKAIFIAIAFMAIGAVLGHIVTEGHHCGKMRGLCGSGYNKEARWDRGDRECEERFEHKFKGEKEGRGENEEKDWFEHKGDAEKCKTAGLSDPNKANCPMTNKKEGKSKKN